MAEYDIIIKGGTIVDGLRTPRYIGDLAIKDGKIAKIGGLRSASADKVLDASGSIVAPGIIDLHTHYDAQIFWDPYLTMSGWHGVTSVAIGNCGFGFAPCRDEDRERAMLALTRNEAIPLKAMQFGMPWDWVTFPEFLDSLDRTPQGCQSSELRPADASLRMGDGMGRGQEKDAQQMRSFRRCGGFFMRGWMLEAAAGLLKCWGRTLCSGTTTAHQ